MTERKKLGRWSASTRRCAIARERSRHPILLFSSSYTSAIAFCCLLPVQRLPAVQRLLLFSVFLLFSRFLAVLPFRLVLILLPSSTSHPRLLPLFCRNEALEFIAATASSASFPYWMRYLSSGPRICPDDPDLGDLP